MNIDNLGQQGPPAESSSCRRHIQVKDGRRRRRMSTTTRTSDQEDSAAAGGLSSYENISICSKKKRAVIPKDGVSVIPSRDGVMKDLEVQAGGSGVSCRSYGKISVIGRRRQNEDSVAVELGFLGRGDNYKNYDFFGVYDGHGGCRVAEACGEVLHKLLAQNAEEKMGSSSTAGGDIDWEKVMTEGFQKMDAEVNKNGAAVATMGSTAVVAVVGGDKLVVANCGDSRAVLSRGGEAIPLSDDHKPDRPDELKRIEVCGGKVLNWNGQRVLGVLATSRSIGDYYLKPYVATEPEVRIMKRSHVDECLILASDGLWDVISNDLACQVARRCFDGRLRRSSRRFPRIGISDYNDQSCSGYDDDGSGKNESDDAAEAAALLAELALARGSKDNISVVVVRLKAASNSGRNSPPPSVS